MHRLRWARRFTCILRCTVFVGCSQESGRLCYLQSVHSCDAHCRRPLLAQCTPRPYMHNLRRNVTQAGPWKSGQRSRTRDGHDLVRRLLKVDRLSVRWIEAFNSIRLPAACAKVHTACYESTRWLWPSRISCMNYGVIYWKTRIDSIFLASILSINELNYKEDAGFKYLARWWILK